MACTSTTCKFLCVPVVNAPWLFMFLVMTSNPGSSSNECPSFMYQNLSYARRVLRLILLLLLAASCAATEPQGWHTPDACHQS